MKCRGPKCTNEGTHPDPREERAGDLVCASHYQQARRAPERPLRPLRAGDRERIPNVRVMPATLKVLEFAAKENDEPLATRVAGILDEWAKRRAIP